MQNIVLIIVSVLLNCSAQLLIRKGMLDVGEISSGASLISNIPVMLTNIFLWISIFCYLISFIMWIVVLSKMEVSFAYPFLSIGYVISAVAGYMFFAESVTPVRIAGIIVICIGVILISRS